MVKFFYNNAKKTSTDYMFFEVNYGFYLYVSYKKDIDTCFQSKSAKNLITKFKELLVVY